MSATTAGDVLLIRTWDDLHGGLIGTDDAPCYPDLCDDVLEVVAADGLRGRGGAGFPVATKLAAVRGRPGPRIAVANGAEGEPGSVKDRYLLRERPHLVLAGLQVAARAVGADRAYVYLADAVSEQAVRAALAEARGQCHVPVDVHRVEHSYVAGEESALVRALNGGPALPTAKPPRPYESGVSGAPTLVHNVETLAQLALIAARGSTAELTLLATIGGAGASAALWELPVGIVLGDVLREHGVERDELRAVAAGGLFGGLLSDAWHLPLTHESFTAAGSGLGCAAIHLLGRDDCPVDAAADAVAFLAAESSRQCGVCINATAGMRDVLAGLRVGTAVLADVERMAGWSQTVVGRGACTLLDAAARTAASLLREFPADVEQHLRGRCPRCDALGPLPRLTRHHVPWEQS